MIQHAQGAECMRVAVCNAPPLLCLHQFWRPIICACVPSLLRSFVVKGECVILTKACVQHTQLSADHGAGKLSGTDSMTPVKIQKRD